MTTMVLSIIAGRFPVSVINNLVDGGSIILAAFGASNDSHV